MTTWATLTRARGSQARRLSRALCDVSEAVGARRYEVGMRRLRSSLEDDFLPELEAIFRDLGVHVARVTAAKGGLVIENPILPEDEEQEATEAERRPRPPWATVLEEARIHAILEASELDKFAKDKILPWIGRLYESAWVGEYALAQTKLEATQRDKAVRAMLQRGGRRLGLIDLKESTRQAMFRVLDLSRDWTLGQPSPNEVARWIRSEVPAGRFVNAGPAYRARLIARTEILHSTRSASLETARADPYVEFMVAIDGDYDEHCAARNGQTFTIDDAEAENNGEDTHPNCTLMFTPALR